MFRPETGDVEGRVNLLNKFKLSDFPRDGDDTTLSPGLIYDFGEDEAKVRVSGKKRILLDNKNTWVKFKGTKSRLSILQTFREMDSGFNPCLNPCLPAPPHLTLLIPSLSTDLPPLLTPSGWGEWSLKDKDTVLKNYNAEARMEIAHTWFDFSDKQVRRISTDSLAD